MKPSRLKWVEGRGDKKLPGFCFVIGPMNQDHMPKLRFLAEKIVQPILPRGFLVKTPDQFGEGNIMDQVVASCDSAALVIADTTGNNPNVLYEIGVLHSLGRFCIPVKLKRDEDGKRVPPGKSKAATDAVTFDLAAYRCFFLDLKNPALARRDLSNAIQESLDARRKGKPVSNPVTNYYGAPVTEISPASGIALGYCHNFVRNVAIDLAKSGGPVLYGRTKEVEKMKPLTPGLRRKLKLQIVIPNRLNYADHGAIADNLVKTGRLLHAVIKKDFTKDARPQPLYLWPDRSALVDIPTAMNVMRRSIKRRLGRREEIDDRSPEWRRLEDEEIARFRDQLELNMFDAGQDAAVRTHARILNWTETRLKTAPAL